MKCSVLEASVSPPSQKFESSTRNVGPCEAMAETVGSPRDCGMCKDDVSVHFFSSFGSITSLIGLWVVGSIPCFISFFFRLEFQKFLISLSVLPGNCAAIWAHLIKIDPKKFRTQTQWIVTQFHFLSTIDIQINYLLPRTSWRLIIRSSSCCENIPLFKSGLK